MSASIEIFNDELTVMINDQFRCHSLAAKGGGRTVQVSAGTGGEATVSYRTSSSTAPVIAVYCNALVVVEPRAVGPNNYSWRIRSMMQTPSVGFEWFVFDLPDVGIDAGGMIQLFNNSGDIVFDSNLKYMRVIKMLSAGRNTHFEKSYTNVPSGRKYAYSAGNASYTYQRARGSFLANNVWEHTIDYMYYSSAGQLGQQFVHGGRERYLGTSVTGPANFGFFRRQSENSTGMIIDVTDF